MPPPPTPISIAQPGMPLPGFLHLPEGVVEKPRLIVHFPGGGFAYRYPEASAFLCRKLSSALHCAVLEVHYRLAPEHPFPAAVEDAAFAAKWAFENAGRLGCDGAGIVLCGESAGGALAAAASMMSKDVPVLAQILLYPFLGGGRETPSRGEFGAAGNLPHILEAWRAYMPDPARQADPRAAPLFARDLAGLPPAVVVTAEFDPLRDEGEMYAVALAGAGVPVRTYRAIAAPHGFLTSSKTVEQRRAALAFLVSICGSGGVWEKALGGTSPPSGNAHE